MGGAYELAFSIYMYMNPYKGKMLYIYTETLLKRTIIYLLFFSSMVKFRVFLGHILCSCTMKNDLL